MRYSRLFISALVLCLNGSGGSGQLTQFPHESSNASSIFLERSGYARKFSEKNYSFVNGNWFDGKAFKKTSFYSVNGILTKTKPSRIDEVADLKNGFAFPPFGEAHNHNITSEWTLNSETPRYFRQGIFYVKITASIVPRLETIKGKVNQPETLDIVFGSPGLSNTGGHPEPLMRRLATAGVIPGLDPDKLDGTTHFAVDSIAELEAKWPAVLASKADFIKTMLLYSTEKDKAVRRAGLTPEVYRHAVKLAHAAGLRVTTHVETAADFALAVDAGADEIAHLPGYTFRPELGVEAYKIDEASARKAARNGIVVVTTCVLSRVYYEKFQEQSRQIQTHNLKLLHKHGVPIAIGSDVTQSTSLEEAKYLHELGVFDNLTLLKLWSEVTPQSIFPTRKIGKLQPGYESSFLVLGCDPIKKFDCVEDIRLRYKQGRLIEVAVK